MLLLITALWLAAAPPDAVSMQQQRRGNDCPCSFKVVAKNESCVHRFEKKKINSVATQAVIDAEVKAALAECKKGKTCWPEDKAWDNLDNLAKIVSGQEDGQTFSRLPSRPKASA